MLKLDARTNDFAELLAAVPRETIATVGDVAITIPVEVPPSVPLGYTRTRMTSGSDVAVVWAMELLMTTDGFNTLLTASLTESDLDALTAIVIQRVSGATTGAADKAPKASPTAAKTSQRPPRTGTRSRAARK